MPASAPDEVPTTKSGRRPKAPGAAAILTTFALALLVAITGVTSRTAPPPTVAQFAPQAVKQIKSAPKDQSSRFGSGAGTGEGGTAAGASGEGDAEGTAGGSPRPTPPAASPPAIPLDAVAVTRRCIGDPPRQIEDTQSPPCVPFWQGNNGGATWKGVTADEIRIAVPQAPKADAAREVEALQNFFNRRFEFYGRKLVLERPDLTQSDIPEDQRNDAAKVDSLKFFASLGYSYNYYYAAELARRKIISVTSEPYYTDKTLRGFAPYVWQYSMGLDGMLENLGAWSCNRIANRPARHAGDPTLASERRVFGIVGYNIYPEMPLDLSPLQKRLEGCGAKVAYVVNNSTVGTAASPTDAQNTAIQLKDAGVTSVICMCNPFQLTSLFKGATSQRYLPEWLTSTYSTNDSDYVIHQFNNDQTHLDHTFGLTFQPRELRAENTPATWAVKEGSGRPDTPASQTSGNMFQRRNLYHDLLMVASGIQMAGPLLTPKTFEAGLQRAAFPNPVEPSMQGTVGFLGDYSMTDDVGEYYWSSRAVSPYADTAGQGAFCYVDKGRRRTVTTWPTTEPPLGQLPCDSRDQ